MRDAGKNYTDTYLEKLSRIAEGDFGAAVNSPIASMVVEQMMEWLPE